MTINGGLQIAIYFAFLTALALPLGRFMAKVFEGERTFLTPALAPIERGIYRVAGVDPNNEQTWVGYAVAMLVFNAAGFFLLYAILRFQDVLPLNPQGMSSMGPQVAFNTAASFVSNTNWQNYGGESTLSYFSQTVGLTTQNFVSAATGVALLLAVARGFARALTRTVGNFWVDLTRTTLYVLLPLSILLGLFLVWQGVPQNMGAYVDATTLEGATQTLSQGPAASQIAIKQLGTKAAMLSHLRPALTLLAVFTLLTGVAYPFAMTGVAQIVFPRQAAGSLVEHDDKVIGSSVMGQNFVSERYFRSRPSATVAPDPMDSSKTIPAPYNAANSGGSNYGPTSKALIERVRGDLKARTAENPAETVPMDLVTTSASGLDPHLSPEAALFQVARVSKARSLPMEEVRALVMRHVEPRTLGLLGEPRVNVLALNLALDTRGAR